MADRVIALIEQMESLVAMYSDLQQQVAALKLRIDDPAGREDPRYITLRTMVASLTVQMEGLRVAGRTANPDPPLTTIVSTAADTSVLLGRIKALEEDNARIRRRLTIHDQQVHQMSPQGWT